MKIFLAFLQGDPNHPVPAYSFWQYYIKNGIEEAGYTWTEDISIDWAKGLVTQNKLDLASWKTNTWEKTISHLKKHPVNLFLSYLYPHQIDESAIAEIKKMGIPCVNFFCDNVREFKKPPKEFGVFNLNWVPEYKALAMYKKVTFAHTHLPMPMWVEPKFRTLPNFENEQISFIGSKDIQRQLFFEKIIAKAPNLPLNLYGAGWEENNNKKTLQKHKNYTKTNQLYFQINFIYKYGLTAYLRKLQQLKINLNLSSLLQDHVLPKPNFDDYIKITQNSIITLGINRYPSYSFPLHKPNTYSRLRDIEAPMLGACYLTENTEGLAEMYEIGNEIEVYNCDTEFLEKINSLKLDAKKRKNLRINGQKRALQKNAIPVSINTILSNI